MKTNIINNDQTDQPTDAQSAGEPAGADATKSNKLRDWLTYQVQLSLASGVEPDRVNKMLAGMESGQPPNIEASRNKLRASLAEMYIAELGLLNSALKPFIAAKQRPDLTMTELVFINSMVAKLESKKNKLLIVARTLIEI